MGNRMKIFVYGTLRKGDIRNPIIMSSKDPKFICMDTVEGRIYSTGAYPCLDVEASGTVVGEVYDVDKDLVLNVLDRIEGYSPARKTRDNLFLRKVVKTAAGHEVSVYTMGEGTRRYLSGQPHIESGDWIKFIAEREALWQAELDRRQKKGE